MSILLAVAPALPLDDAGKYVAGAFVAFVGVIVIYVAIMAVRLQRMSRELTELNRAVQARERGEAARGDPARREAESLHQNAGLDGPAEVTTQR